jgi:hypothetical protein
VTPTHAATADRTDDLRVARVHLRLGLLTLAVAELEDLFRADALDTDGLAALAEARWRTGDADAATEAARAHLDAGGADEVALCIAAEAVAAEGKPAEARALMDRLPSADAATLDALFAGMPRRAFWAAGPVDRSDIDELRREGDARQPAGPRPAAGQPPRGPASAGSAPGTQPANGVEQRTIPGPREVIDATAGGPWAIPPKRSIEVPTLPGVQRGAHQAGRRVRGQLDPSAELAQARAELATRPDRALLRLALVLRHDPTLAPAVLEALHLRREPGAALIRGDAQRLLGRHLEAEAAFDAAAETLEAP